MSGRKGDVISCDDVGACRSESATQSTSVAGALGFNVSFLFFFFFGPALHVFSIKKATLGFCHL